MLAPLDTYKHTFLKPSTYKIHSSSSSLRNTYGWFRIFKQASKPCQNKIDNNKFPSKVNKEASQNGSSAFFILFCVTNSKSSWTFKGTGNVWNIIHITTWSPYNPDTTYLIRPLRGTQCLKEEKRGITDPFLADVINYLLLTSCKWKYVKCPVDSNWYLTSSGQIRAELGIF